MRIEVFASSYYGKEGLWQNHIARRLLELGYPKAICREGGGCVITRYRNKNAETNPKVLRRKLREALRYVESIGEARYGSGTITIF